MAIAQIATGDAMKVREHWDAYREKWDDFRPMARPPKSASSAADYLMEPHARMTVRQTACLEGAREAYDKLLAGLRSKAITCHAQRPGDGKTVPVPFVEWVNLKFADDSGVNEIVLKHGNFGRVAYRNPMFPRIEILRLPHRTSHSVPSGEVSRRKRRVRSTKKPRWGATIPGLVLLWLDKNGDPEKPGKNRSDCVDDILGWCADTYDLQPAASTVDLYLTKALPEWRRRQS
jgi:hypothetical protein